MVDERKAEIAKAAARWHREKSATSTDRKEAQRHQREADRLTKRARKEQGS